MRLSAPVFRLKREAKLMARQDSIPLHKAQDRIAQREGFQRWSHLAAHTGDVAIGKEVLDQLNPGELVLFAGKRNHGKTTLAFHVLAEAIRAKRSSNYFSLVENPSEIEHRLAEVGIEPTEREALLSYDTSEEICASYIIDRCKNAAPGSVIVVDYLQILDQQRDKPVLADQIDALHSFAEGTQVIIALISQIDRTFELSAETIPSLGHVRLPNPVDLEKFAKFVIIHEGEVTVNPTS